MRVSSNMMTGNYLRQLNKSFQEQANLMEQTDGDKIHRPSDDPVEYIRTMQFQNSITQNEQYTSNLKSATSWMDSSDGAMVNINNILADIKAKVTKADSSKDTEAIGKEIDALIEQLVTVANSQVGDRYLFAGQMDRTKPFVISEVVDKADVKTLDDSQSKLFGTDQMLVMNDGTNTYYVDPNNGNIYDKEYVDEGYKKTIGQLSGMTEAQLSAAVQGEASGTFNGGQVNISDIFTTNGTLKPAYAANSFGVTPKPGSTMPNQLSFSVSTKKVVKYMGDDKDISMPIQNGGATPSRDSVNTTGVDLFGKDIFGGSGAAVLNDLFEISSHMKDNDDKWLTSDGMQLADKAVEQGLGAETKLAARKGAYDDTLTMLEKQHEIIKADITKSSGADVAKLSMELNVAKTLYNMSLSVAMQILPQSLADYL